MSADMLVMWIFVCAWIVVLALIAFIVLPQIVHEARRIIGRVMALVDESALPMQIAKAEADVARIERALAAVGALDLRARAAIAEVRRTSLVPPALADTVVRIGAEIRAFRAALN